IYPFRPSEYYFNFSLPVFVLAISIILGKIINKKSFWLNFILISVLLLLFKHSINFIGPDADSIYFKEKVVSYIKAVTYSKSDFDLSLDFKNGKDAGFYYLLYFNNLAYNKKDKSGLIQIVSPGKDNCLISEAGYSLCFNPVDFGW
ncbi:MAG: hypothetical protein ACPLXL_01530, partial [Minisyncoccia bacterium]